MDTCNALDERDQLEMKLISISSRLESIEQILLENSVVSQEVLSKKFMDAFNMKTAQYFANKKAREALD